MLHTTAVWYDDDDDADMLFVWLWLPRLKLRFLDNCMTWWDDWLVGWLIGSQCVIPPWSPQKLQESKLKLCIQQQFGMTMMPIYCSSDPDFWLWEKKGLKVISNAGERRIQKQQAGRLMCDCSLIPFRHCLVATHHCFSGAVPVYLQLLCMPKLALRNSVTPGHLCCIYHRSWNWVKMLSRVGH